MLSVGAFGAALGSNGAAVALSIPFDRQDFGSLVL